LFVIAIIIKQSSNNDDNYVLSIHREPTKLVLFVLIGAGGYGALGPNVAEQFTLSLPDGLLKTVAVFAIMVNVSLSFGVLLASPCELLEQWIHDGILFCCNHQQQRRHRRQHRQRQQRQQTAAAGGRETELTLILGEAGIAQQQRRRQEQQQQQRRRGGSGGGERAEEDEEEGTAPLAPPAVSKIPKYVSYHQQQQQQQQQQEEEEEEDDDDDDDNGTSTSTSTSESSGSGHGSMTHTAKRQLAAARPGLRLAVVASAAWVAVAFPVST
jgi:hypothetical protein